MDIKSEESFGHFYWTYWEDNKEPVDILRMDEMLVNVKINNKNKDFLKDIDYVSKLFYKVSIVPNAADNFRKIYYPELKELSQICPYNEEDLPVYHKDLPYLIVDITPPEIRSNINEILASAGMTHYKAFELVQRIGYETIQPLKPRSVYSDKYFTGTGEYLVERWLTEKDKYNYFNSLPKVTYTRLGGP